MGLNKKVSKIFLSVNDNYVFSKKRSPRKPKKDKKLELIGGQLDSKETFFQALIRELQEEEESGILAQKAKALNPTYKEIIVKGEPHFIYTMNLNKDEFKKLIPNTEESYGFHLIQQSLVLNKEKLKSNIKLFTPKTLLILSELNYI